MGKTLVIKDTDFSNNSIIGGEYKWFLDSFNEEYIHKVGQQNSGFFAPGNYAEVQGKTINCVKLKVASAGTFTIGIASNLTNSDIYNSRTIYFLSNEVNTVVIKTFSSIEVPQNGYIVIASPNDTGSWYYISDNNCHVGTGYSFRVGYGGHGTITNIGTGDLCISFGYLL